MDVDFKNYHSGVNKLHWTSWGHSSATAYGVDLPAPVELPLSVSSSACGVCAAHGPTQTPHTWTA